MALLSTSFLIIRKDFFNQAKNYPPLSFGRCPDAIRHGLVGEGVVLPHQFVGAVVFIGNGYGSPGYGGYVPVVVVGVGIGVVAAVLVRSPHNLEMSGLSHGVIKRAASPVCILST